MGLPTIGGGNDSSGSGGCEGVRTPLLDYCGMVYCDLSDTGDMSRSGAASGGAGDPTVVGLIRPHLWTGGREGVRRGG